MVARARFDVLRSVTSAELVMIDTYYPVDDPFDYKARMVCFTNNTDGDTIFTDDVSEDRIFVAAGSFKLWDLQSNMNVVSDDSFALPIGTQFSVKRIEAMTGGSIYIENIYG